MIENDNDLVRLMEKIIVKRMTKLKVSMLSN